MYFIQNGTTGIFMNSTVRQTIHTSIGGKQIRLRISNNFGDSNLEITSAGVGLPFGGASGVSAILKDSAVSLTFSGEKSIIIPNGALAVSDPIDFDIGPQSELAIDLFLAGGQGGFNITSHPGSRATTWMTFGDQVGALNLTGADLTSVQHWYVPFATFSFLLCQLTIDPLGISSAPSKSGPSLPLSHSRSLATVSQMDALAPLMGTIGSSFLAFDLTISNICTI